MAPWPFLCTCEDLSDVIHNSCYEHQLHHFIWHCSCVCHVPVCINIRITFLLMSQHWFHPFCSTLIINTVCFKTECIRLESDTLFQWRKMNATIWYSPCTVLIKHWKNIYRLIAIVWNWRGGDVVLLHGVSSALKWSGVIILSQSGSLLQCFSLSSQYHCKQIVVIENEAQCVLMAVCILKSTVKRWDSHSSRLKVKLLVEQDKVLRWRKMDLFKHKQW